MHICFIQLFFTFLISIFAKLVIFISVTSVYVRIYRCTHKHLCFYFLKICILKFDMHMIRVILQQRAFSPSNDSTIFFFIIFNYSNKMISFIHHKIIVAMISIQHPVPVKSSSFLFAPLGNQDCDSHYILLGTALGTQSAKHFITCE